MINFEEKETSMSGIPHTHFTEAENKAANLGARMAGEGFNEDDNPYEIGDDRHDAWWRGFSWCHRLVGHIREA
jgi:hypothetical protein